ncbi:hypothetical protein GKC56_03460 [Neisseriaceae bacterium PsAf]|nr:hypothetical protein [Neisseriaceae bacterium PsAf]MCV2503060.1 DUF177 domain-containing protein [Neisseriaceae bacterium]
MKTDWVIDEVDDFTRNEKNLTFDYKISDLSKRVSSSELFASLEDNIYGIIKGETDELMRPIIRLELEGDIKLICQVCLKPFSYHIDEKVDLIVFENDEDLTKALHDDNVDIEGIVGENNVLNLLDLIEDQVLLAMPFSPQHEHCENERLKEINKDRPNPFSILKN